MLLLGDGASERRPLSISSSNLFNFPKQNLFQFILVLEDVPPVEDESVELQRKCKKRNGLVSGIGSRGNVVNISEISISWSEERWGSPKQYTDDSHKFELDLDWSGEYITYVALTHQ